jgi:hypothetical protein
MSAVPNFSGEKTKAEDKYKKSIFVLLPESAKPFVRRVQLDVDNIGNSFWISASITL